MRIRTAVCAVCGTLALSFFGCSQSDESAQAPATQPSEMASPATQPVAMASPGAAPTFGEPSGMGLSTGDALHSDGQGSGLAGYHGTGAAGTSGAITDTHQEIRQAPADATTQPVLPPA